MATAKEYVKMQKAIYDRDASTWSISNRNPVVGTFDGHNNWKDYEDFLFKDINTNNLIALDFGCGPGRNIVKFNSNFKRIDGVDISSINLEKARLWIRHNLGEALHYLYQSDGITLNSVSNSYDLIFSTICLQHICSHSIREVIFKEMFRLLNPGGFICHQMGFGISDPLKKFTVPYKQDFFQANTTNGGSDVCIDSVSCIKEDLESYGFTDFKSWIRPVGPGDDHPNWIFFQARKV